jgi:mono/diheme cytochrome c family protein
MRPTRTILAACAGLALAAAARAEQPADFQTAFDAEARRSDPAFSGLSPARGAAFFGATHGGDWSCASCHGQDPRAAGEHVVTGKQIAPLAPSANPERFVRPDKVEKWFKRNCNDVLQRPCTAQEKGDVLVWLMSLGG